MNSHLPNMHMEGFGETLRTYATQVDPSHAIVEVGSWLGGSAYHLADASGPQPLHLYDKWIANVSEVDKAIIRGEDGLKAGESFLPIVKRNLEEFGERIHYHQGMITDARYEGPPIGLYVDDASKNNLINVLPIFRRHFAPGAILVLMDYFWQPCDEQRDYIGSRGWEFLGRDERDTNAAIWKAR